MIHVNRIFRAAAIGALLVVASPSQAQQVLASSGGHFQNANTRIAFTIGEPVVATHAAGGAIATQGFHQPADDFSTEVVSIADPAFHVNVFPNPAREQVTVQVGGEVNGLRLELVDAAGRVIEGLTTLGPSTDLDVSALASGSYAIRIASDERFLAHIKLIITR